MKLRKIVSLFLSALTLAGLLTGCGGGGKDWSKASWDDYDPATFLAKEDIAYCLGVYEKTTSTDQYAAMAPTHLMLYKDGSAAAYSCFDVKEVFHMFESECGIQIYDDNEIITAWYGYWSEKDGTVNITLKGYKLQALYENGALKEGINLDETLVVKEYEAEVEDGILTILDFQTVGANEELVGHPVQSTNPPKYKNLQEFLDSIPENMPAQ